MYVIMILVTIVWTILGGILYFISSNWEDRGTFGDMFGSVNVLFSGLAFAAILYTIHLQKQDLDIQREVQKIQIEDIKTQALATAKSAEQLEAQQRLMNFQICQDTVLNLIEVRKKMNNDLKIRGLNSAFTGTVEITGVAAVYQHYSQLTQQGEDVNDDSFFARYFRIYFYTLQFIEESDLTEKQKNILADINRIETSDIELDIIKENFIEEYLEIDRNLLIWSGLIE